MVNTVRRVVILAALGLAACGEPSGWYAGEGMGTVEVEPAALAPTDGGDDAGLPDAGETDAGVEVDAGVPVSFRLQISPVLSSRCGNCHSFSYSALMTRSRVVPFKPSSSAVYTRTVSGNMPPSGSRLSATQEQLLFDWISQGALNN